MLARAAAVRLLRTPALQHHLTASLLHYHLLLLCGCSVVVASDGVPLPPVAFDTRGLGWRPQTPRVCA